MIGVTVVDGWIDEEYTKQYYESLNLSIPEELDELVKANPRPSTTR